MLFKIHKNSNKISINSINTNGIFYCKVTTMCNIHCTMHIVHVPMYIVILKHATHTSCKFFFNLKNRQLKLNIHKMKFFHKRPNFKYLQDF